MPSNYRTWLLSELPVKECVVEDENGDFDIYINSNLTLDEQRKEYKHALGHIFGNDFEKFNVQSIETDAHNLPKE